MLNEQILHVSQGYNLLKALDAVGIDQVYVTPSNRNNGVDHPAAFWGENNPWHIKHSIHLAVGPVYASGKTIPLNRVYLSVLTA